MIFLIFSDQSNPNILNEWHLILPQIRRLNEIHFFNNDLKINTWRHLIKSQFVR